VELKEKEISKNSGTERKKRSLRTVELKEKEISKNSETEGKRDL
jgi:hypothetical protein